MADLSGFPYAEAEFDRDGNLNPPDQGERVLQALGAWQATDLVVISHGWNNDMGEARNLYAELFQHVRTVWPMAGLEPNRSVGILGILWPAKKFTDRELIPGGGAAALGEAENAELEKDIDRLKAVAAADAPNLDEAKALLDNLEFDPAARRDFVDLVRRSLDPPAVATAELDAERDALGDSEQLFTDLRGPFFDTPHQQDAGGAANLGDSSGSGGAAGIGSMFSSAKAAAERLLNYATYYQMKERAGRIGSTGVAKLLRTLHRDFPQLRLHLVGHSFGARVVSAAADACGADVKLSSMLLLQAAFSHNGFAPQFAIGNTNHVGFFRKVVQGSKIKGPIVISHTRNDKAVGLAYAIASRVARQVANALGDENDPYGGLGRNGAIRTPEAQAGGDLLPAGGNYAFTPGRIQNLRADQFIAGHSEIRNDAVAYALLKTIS